jgi:hypothetical protein
MQTVILVRARIEHWQEILKCAAIRSQGDISCPFWDLTMVYQMVQISLFVVEARGWCEIIRRSSSFSIRTSADGEGIVLKELRCSACSTSTARSNFENSRKLMENRVLQFRLTHYVHCTNIPQDTARAKRGAAYDYCQLLILFPSHRRSSSEEISFQAYSSLLQDVSSSRGHPSLPRAPQPHPFMTYLMRRHE